uniref:Pentatricopeptide repeat-containing protein n=1 Tax=Ananas comosus var. bracteatus TaxID=296719 RepID=A0A6V7P5R4_ANACO|nr:unnamed protein product [Ananas comosus var. bracteatus]
MQSSWKLGEFSPTNAPVARSVLCRFFFPQRHEVRSLPVTARDATRLFKCFSAEHPILNPSAASPFPPPLLLLLLLLRRGGAAAAPRRALDRQSPSHRLRPLPIGAPRPVRAPPPHPPRRVRGPPPPPHRGLSPSPLRARALRPRGRPLARRLPVPRRPPLPIGAPRRCPEGVRRNGEPRPFPDASFLAFVANSCAEAGLLDPCIRLLNRASEFNSRLEPYTVNKVMSLLIARNRIQDAVFLFREQLNSQLFMPDVWSF